MTLQTPLDHAHAAMQADPDANTPRLRFYDRLAEAELFLMLAREADGDQAEPELFDLGDVRFVLATEASHMLLPTIRSRCLAHTMQWPETDEALTWLTGQGLQAPEASALLRSAGASAVYLAWAWGIDSSAEGDARGAEQGEKCKCRGWQAPRCRRRRDVTA